MAESAIEKRHVKGVEAQGGISYKFVSPNRRGVPDRLDLFPILPEHREIVAKYVVFTELKDTGKNAEDYQIREHERLRKLGFSVEVKDR